MMKVTTKSQTIGLIEAAAWSVAPDVAGYFAVGLMANWRILTGCSARQQRKLHELILSI